MTRRAVALVALLLVTACTSSANEDFASTPKPSGTQQAVDEVDIVITRPDWPSLVTDDVAPPTRDAVPLSEKPVRRASLAVSGLAGDHGVYVLGRDGEWRRVDGPRLTYHVEGSGTWPALQPNSLDASGTRLAIAQDGSLVVIDLTTGGFRRYPVPGLDQHVAWEDPSHVLVVTSTRMRGTLVDLETGALTESDHRRTTRVLPDGRALTWGGGRDVASPANNTASFSSPPLARRGVAIGISARNNSMQTDWIPTGDEALDDLMGTHHGIAAVDSSNGYLLGLLQLSESWSSTPACSAGPVTGPCSRWST